MGCTRPLGIKLVFSNKLVFLYQRQQMSDIFSSIAWYYGDNDLIVQTFNFIARSDVHTWLVVPDTD